MNSARSVHTFSNCDIYMAAIAKKGRCLAVRVLQLGEVMGMDVVSVVGSVGDDVWVYR